MGYDLIIKYLSHSNPPKKLVVHTKGVIDNSRKITNSKITELAAIFHDVGKMNLGFQVKVNENTENDFRKLTHYELNYSHHAYISAYAFYCFCLANSQLLKDELGDGFQIELLAIIALIARHHGNLPDFKTFNPNKEFITKDCFYLSDKELSACKNFIENVKLPVIDFIESFSFLENKNIRQIDGFWGDSKYWKAFESLGNVGHFNKTPLKFYQETQFSFAALIQADKKDAGYINTQDKENITNFCKQFSVSFEDYLKTLEPYQNKPINQLRTSIRSEATANVSKILQESNKRVFDLTAPTGSGKTLSLLSIANEIIKQKGNFRVIYSLPFLSITEQVEKEVLSIFKGLEEFVQRIDSKSVNKDLQKLQEELDKKPSDEKHKELTAKQFQENTFEYPFIITTFVRFFEAFLKNKNADLLKLPSFSNCIFLIDEIQALPPRLYGFFVAYLDAFCRRFNSYAVVSTATMPNFGISRDDTKEFFSGYNLPPKLLSKNYFENDLFNRYIIDIQKEEIRIQELANKIITENKSVLCIVNTIDDSKDLFEELNKQIGLEEVCLLNTHFTPNDRKSKIEYAKLRLKYGKKIVLISTQLIEAGVDIDFPVLYRDMSIMPSIVQSAGRCNRNGKLDKGRVILFHLNNRGKNRSRLIYRGKDKKLLGFTINILNDLSYQEKELFNEQEAYFNKLQNDLMFGKHEQSGKQLNFIELIKEASFASLGQFKLIDEEYYGEVYQIYVPQNNSDNSFQRLELKVKALGSMISKDWNIINKLKGEIKILLKEMSNQIVQVRLKKHEIKPNFQNQEEVKGLMHLNIDDYDNVRGIKLSNDNLII